MSFLVFSCGSDKVTVSSQRRGLWELVTRIFSQILDMKQHFYGSREGAKILINWFNWHNLKRRGLLIAARGDISRYEPSAGRVADDVTFFFRAESHSQSYNHSHQKLVAGWRMFELCLPRKKTKCRVATIRFVRPHHSYNNYDIYINMNTSVLHDLHSCTPYTSPPSSPTHHRCECIGHRTGSTHSIKYGCFL